MQSKVLYVWKTKEKENLLSQGYKECNINGRKVLCLNCKC